MISNILVATDGSKTAKNSVRYAIDLAKQTGAAVIFLSVIDKSLFVMQSVPAVASPTHLKEPIEDFLRQAAEAYIAEAEALCRKGGVESRSVIRSGHPVEEIVKEAEKSKVDLIIMGAHGTGILKTSLMGSVTFGVMQKDSKIPVLVTRK